MLNSIILVGRLTADPEMRYTQSGIAQCKFTMAVDRNFKNASGERDTDFIYVIAWRKSAELIGQYVGKGNMLGIRGSLQTRKYQDKDGNNRTAFEVIVEDFQFLEPKRDGTGSPGPRPPQQRGPQPPPAGPAYDATPPEPPPDNLMDDDLPF